LLKTFSKLLLLAACAIVTSAQDRPAPAPAVLTPRKTFDGAAGDYKRYDPATLENGKKTFSANCAFCHGSNAKGGETGPDLLRSLIVLHDENGEGIGPVVLNGRPDKGMPKFNLSTAQISEIVAFLHDGVRAAAMRGTYQILNIVVGNPKAGATYFNGAGKCTSCHSVTGDLAHIGAKYDAVAVQQKILMPRQGRSYGRRSEGVPDIAPITVTVTLPSGETVNGRLEHIDDFNLSLIDSAGDRRSFSRDGETPRVELHDPLEAHIKLLKIYTDSDIHDLTAYLLTLK
jgi:mono/diheme cytochrome c family protein